MTREDEAVPDAPQLTADFWSALAAAPWQYDLFQLLRHIDARSGARYPLGRAPLPRDERLRIRQQPSLAFAPATLAQVSHHSAAEPSVPVTISVRNFGLFGPGGPLPLQLTEYAHQRIHHAQDRSLAAFADLFHHRLALLFWRSWADAQPTVSLDRRDSQPFAHYLACLTGSGLPQPSRNQSLSAHARFAVAGHLCRHGCDAEAIGRILRHYFQVPVSLQENLPYWLPLHRRDRARLVSGHQACRLGVSAFLGCHTRDRQRRFCLELGPMPLAAYRRFLPAQRAQQQLRNWLRQLLGMEFAWEARVLLAASDITGITLGGERQLGWTSWLGNGGVMRARDAMVIRPPDAAGRR